MMDWKEMMDLASEEDLKEMAKQLAPYLDKVAGSDQVQDAADEELKRLYGDIEREDVPHSYSWISQIREVIGCLEDNLAPVLIDCSVLDEKESSEEEKGRTTLEASLLNIWERLDTLNRRVRV